MKASRCLTLALTFTLLLAVSSHADQTIPDNLIVNGWVDADGNSISFGTQGATFGAALLHADSNTDTFTFLSNRNPASWLWLHSAAVAAMRLDSAHQLILYQADGTTAGLTFAPASNSIKLGSHANGTLTADANGVITAGGGFTVAGNFTNTSGTLTGSASAFTSLSVNGSSTFGVTNTLTGSVETFAFLAPNAGDGNQVYGFLGLARATGKSAVLDFYAGTAGAAYADSFFALGLYGENPANSFKLSAGGALTLGGTITGQGQLNLNSAGAPSLSQQNNKINLTGQGTGVDGIYMANTTGTFVVGIEGSAGNQVGVNTSAYDAVIGTIGAKKIDFITNNTVRAVIDSAGNVGIGTTSPEAKLDVAGVVNIPANTWFTGNGNGLLRDSYFGYSSSYRAIQIGSQLGSETGNSQAIALGIDPATITGGAFFGDEIALPNQVEFMQANSGKTDWIQNVLVLNNGNVGIGTANPVGKLSILAPDTTVGPALALRQANAPAYGFDIDIEQISVARMDINRVLNGVRTEVISILRADGNVGIGTTNPGQKLEVNGNALVDGNLLQINNSGTPELYMNKIGTRGWSIRNDGAFNVFNWQDSNNYLTIVNGGNVGIGTTSPTSKTHLSVGNVDGLRVESGNSGYLEVGKTNATRWRWANDYNQANLLELLVGTSGSAPTTSLVTIKSDGNVGIGTTAPNWKMHVLDDKLPGVATTLYPLGIGNAVAPSTLLVGFSKNASNAPQDVHINVIPNIPLTFYTNNIERMTIAAGGNIGIGTVSPTAKLAVNGTIRAKEVIVDTGWADYVFAEDYRLAPLAEVESHIREKKHLPGIPSAAEVAEHGVSMGDMQSKLLSKVEELTLHLIEQEKRINRLEQENRQLRTQTANP